ncbi:hypothetical protein C5471_00120 [Photorhabdus tasmaniensis]|uniref:Uncharacterized protein n=1 Tax=Photorhabdus tasmaniensis TaxID=1004159 RepID=A0ABX0GBE4_9GAMM|nr:hypothetical protein [Photorhabdus tasmaniensis]
MADSAQIHHGHDFNQTKKGLRDQPIHRKRTLWIIRYRFTCRACKTTFRPQLLDVMLVIK